MTSFHKKIYLTSGAFALGIILVIGLIIFPLVRKIGADSQELFQKEKTVEKMDLTEKTDKICPECQGSMVIRLGRFGKFYACSKFPNCKHTEPLPKPSLNIECPKCGQGEIVEKITKKKKIFYGCSLWPKCDFALWDKPVNEFCSNCNSIMIETKNKKRKCSNKTCSSIINAAKIKKLKKET